MEVWIRPSWYYLCPGESMPYPVPGSMWDRPLGEKLYAQYMTFARRLDELGFDGFIFTEHHYSPNGGLTPSPIVLLAAASQVTERIKLVTMGLPLALYPHPVRVAEELAMVDNLSHGRLVVGVISGGAPNLYAYNIPASEDRTRFREAYDLIVRAWEEETPFEWHGEHYEYPCVSILPRPLQQPHPRTWTVASSAESLEWAAARHMGLIASGPLNQAAETLNYYRDYCRGRRGWEPTSADLGLAREFFIAPTMEEARAMAEGLMESEGEAAFALVQRAPQLAELRREAAASRTYGYRTRASAPTEGRRTTGAMSGGQFLAGDPDSITQEILRQRETTGAGVLLIRPEMGGLSLEAAAEGLELFAREVLPVVHKA